MPCGHLQLFLTLVVGGITGGITPEIVPAETEETEAIMFLFGKF